MAPALTTYIFTVCPVLCRPQATGTELQVGGSSVAKLLGDAVEPWLLLTPLPAGAWAADGARAAGLSCAQILLPQGWRKGGRCWASPQGLSRAFPLKQKDS